MSEAAWIMLHNWTGLLGSLIGFRFLPLAVWLKVTYCILNALKHQSIKSSS